MYTHNRVKETGHARKIVVTEPKIAQPSKHGPGEVQVGDRRGRGVGQDVSADGVL